MYKPQKIYYPKEIREKLLYAVALFNTLSNRQRVNAYDTYEYYER